MKLRVIGSDIHLTNLRLRIPFKYGIATMTEMPYLFLRVHVEIGGRRASGLSADCLPAKWFTKDPTRAIAAEVEEMLRVIENAAQLAQGLTGENAFDVWQQLHHAQAAWGAKQKLPPLLTHFGTSLVERALIEAVCRDAQLPFAALLRENRLGIRMGEVHPQLRGTQPRDWLPTAPLARVVARHTVGLADALLDADLPAAEQLTDGLPQSLEACIRRYGLRHFKLKTTGNITHDAPRLITIAEIITRLRVADFAFTLDGNEAFKEVENFRAWWEALVAQPELKTFFAKLLFVEQPLHRDAALDPRVAMAFAHWPDRPPVIIDESDGELDCLARALELGYAGTSHKNCKGVFKGVINRCLLAHRAQLEPARPWLMSGEDLCGVGPVAMLQDLAVQAALGNASVERNGHHYVAGLSGFSPAVQDLMLGAHPDLYAPSPAGWPTLRVRAGELDIASVNRAPLGVGPVLPLDDLPTAAEWRQTNGG